MFALRIDKEAQTLTNYDNTYDELGILLFFSSFITISHYINDFNVHNHCKV